MTTRCRTALVAGPFVVGVVVGLAGCGGPSTTDEAPGGAREEVAAPRVTVARAPDDLALLEAPARVVASPGSEARVSASHEARVVAVHVRAGDRVEVGAPIVDVVMPEVLAAAARLASVGPAHALRTARRSELAALQGEGLVDRASVFEQETELASLDVERRLALSTLRAASLTTAEAAQALRRGAVTLRAPIAGVVRDVSAVVGEVRAAGGEPFAVIAAPLPARIEARFAEGLPREVDLLFVGIDGTRIALSPEPSSTALDPHDGAERVWLEPVTPTEIAAPVGGRVIATITGGDAVEIDARALVLEGTGALIERLDASDAVTRVPVEVLTASGTRAIVRGRETPLAVGDRISLEPARAVAEGE